MRFLSLFGLFALGVLSIAMLGCVVCAWYVGRRRRAAATFGAWLGALGIYATILVGVSLASREHVLPPGAEKRFCTLDCDLAYSVEQVYRVDHASPGRDVLIVRIRGRNAARSARMRPSDFRAWLLAPNGARIDPVTVSRPALLGELSPGESRTMELQFEIPERSQNLRLAVAEGGWPSRLAIGDENSFLHHKTVFQIQEPLQARANPHHER